MKIRHVIIMGFLLLAAVGIAITAISDDSMFNRKVGQETMSPRLYLKVPNQHSESSFRISPPMLRSDIDVAGITYVGDEIGSL